MNLIQQYERLPAHQQIMFGRQVLAFAMSLKMLTDDMPMAAISGADLAAAFERFITGRSVLEKPTFIDEADQSAVLNTEGAA